MEIVVGMVFNHEGKMYTVLNIQEDIVKYCVVKLNKSAKIKEKSLEKFKKLVKKANKNNTKTKNNSGNNEILIKGYKIDIRKLIGSNIPLLGNKLENVYIFSLDLDSKNFLVGFGEDDENPQWINIEKILNVIKPDFLEEISEKHIDIKTDSFKNFTKEDILKLFEEN